MATLFQLFTAASLWPKPHLSGCITSFFTTLPPHCPDHTGLSLLFLKHASHFLPQDICTCCSLPWNILPQISGQVPSPKSPLQHFLLREVILKFPTEKSFSDPHFISPHKTHDICHIMLYMFIYRLSPNTHDVRLEGKDIFLFYSLLYRQLCDGYQAKHIAGTKEIPTGKINFVSDQEAN